MNPIDPIEYIYIYIYLFLSYIHQPLGHPIVMFHISFWSLWRCIIRRQVDIFNCTMSVRGNSGAGAEDETLGRMDDGEGNGHKEEDEEDDDEEGDDDDGDGWWWWWWWWWWWMMIILIVSWCLLLFIDMSWLLAVCWCWWMILDLVFAVCWSLLMMSCQLLGKRQLTYCRGKDMFCGIKWCVGQTSSPTTPSIAKLKICLYNIGHVSFVIDMFLQPLFTSQI